ncbi:MULTISPECIES: FAD:protein FMN transferase [Shewanella]|nr:MULTISPECIES: FAD:protein FMN transferase [Shewanella]
MDNQYQLTKTTWGFRVCFASMASPCELLIKQCQIETAHTIARFAVTECARIENKYSRYKYDSMLTKLNDNAGRWQNIDEETSAIFYFAQQCHELSDGLFDITAGRVLALWSYATQAKLPDPLEIEQAIQHVGFEQIMLEPKRCFIPSGMRLDLGGIGKEYACDRISTHLKAQYPALPVLVNLGGDISCSLANPSGWKVGIEDPKLLNTAVKFTSLVQGALTTSGNTRRVINIGEKTYGHIISPQTGYPVEYAPISVTVKAENCLIAGMLSTIAMLKGKESTQFLDSQNVEHEIFY